ncbi:uncharacterized protein EHS24_008196 [Apiotrichum porosum]|uniref:DUF5745 domain-containing protein n=1 Tax=Apiotrichum porosum TaxID=105984 RepID=A0A427XT28_9TREE|nr:uncharacterized protein EHS24_008196 [Apiotrichum porosum]RSH81994.1 hypothetical protein EHS24_008196 [Apiotrichum porosum]
MPTPPLPVLHALLTALGIPVLPPALNCIPPTLLLLILETLLGHRLALSPHLRNPATHDDELELTKCVLGVLADDVLALDLAVVDPGRVCDGSEVDIAVVVMALAVVARRRGVPLRLPTPIDSDDEGEVEKSMLDDDEAAGLHLPPLTPLMPAVLDKYVTPPSGNTALPAIDLVAAHEHRPDSHLGQTPSASAVAYACDGSRNWPAVDGAPPPHSSPPGPNGSGTSLGLLTADEYATLDPLSPPIPSLPSTPVNQTAQAPLPQTPSSGRRRTVLQQLIDEFGLEPV